MPIHMRMRKLRGPHMKKSMPFEQFGRTQTQPVNLKDLDARFDQTGHWREPPQAWPERTLEDKQFLQALERCLAMLPARTGQVFLMREHLGFETADICKEVGITPTHCWVLLYRARMALRECLGKGGFGR